MTSTGGEGLEAQERQGARGGIYTDEIQITNFTFMPAKNMMENMGLGSLAYGAGAQQRQGSLQRESLRAIEGGVGKMGKELRQDFSKAKENI